MTLDQIIAVTGKPGLYKIVAQSKSSIIVESLLDNKRTPITATQNVSVLDNIAIYTFEEEVPLREVFKSISEKEGGKACISHKESNNKVVDYFSEILPEYDEERVYPSNIKKVLQWYNLLVKNNFDFTKLSEEETSEETEA